MITHYVTRCQHFVWRSASIVCKKYCVGGSKVVGTPEEVARKIKRSLRMERVFNPLHDGKKFAIFSRRLELDSPRSFHRFNVE